MTHPRSVAALDVRFASLFILAAALLACGQPASDSSTLRGRTSDELGAQKQGLGGESLGGSGSLSAATKVRVSRIGNDGALTRVAESEVKTGGIYEVKLPGDGEKKLIAQALDASGNVRESVIIENSGNKGDEVTAAPMDSETSVEAEILVQMVAQGVELSEANAIDLRARINAKTAEAVKASTDAAARIKALAESVAAAQRAQLKAYAEAGVQTTQSSLFDAQLSAAAKLNAALDVAADKAAAEKAYDDFISELEATAREKTGDVKKASRGERAASIAFRATVKARLQVSGQATDATADAAARHAAALEARAATYATESVLTAGAAAQAQVDAIKTAGTTLRASLSGSTSIAASAQAYATYRATIVGSGGVSGSILGNYLEVNGATSGTVQPAVNASANAATQLDTSINAAVTTSIQASNAINLETYAQAIVAALKTFDATVQAQATNLVGFGSKADVALELMIQANGALRVAE